MPFVRISLFVAVVAALAALAPGNASAHVFALRGLVLAVDAAKGTVIVRPDATSGSSAPTTAFSITPKSELRHIKVGASISASVDGDTVPPTLHNVRALGAQKLTGAAGEDASELALRTVPLLRIGDRVPDTRFVDQLGRRFSFRTLRGQTAVVAFVYTRCRDARECPLISAKFHALQTALARTPSHLVEVSLDPAYDRPPVLARYGRVFGADPHRWSLLTGNPKDVLDFAAAFGVTAFPDPRIGLIHSERTAIVDGDGAVRQLIDEVSWSPDEIVAQIRADRRLASNPFERLNLWLSSAAVAVCGNGVASFSGFDDLAIVLAIVGLAAFIAWRIARSIFRSA